MQEQGQGVVLGVEGDVTKYTKLHFQQFKIIKNSRLLCNADKINELLAVLSKNV